MVVFWQKEQPGCFCNQGQGVALSALNAKASKVNEGPTTIFGGQHRMSKTLPSVELIKVMMDHKPECPYGYVQGKEFLPDFVIVGNNRLSNMRVLQMWYLEAVELSLGLVPVEYPSDYIFSTSVEFLKLTVSFVGFIMG